MAEAEATGDSNLDSKTGEAVPDTEVRQVKSTGDIHSYMCLGTRFDVTERYVVVDSVGQGAYGVVCAAQDKKSKSMVAIKKIENVFEHSTFTKRTLRELKILRLMAHENVRGGGVRGGGERGGRPRIRGCMCERGGREGAGGKAGHAASFFFAASEARLGRFLHE